MQPQPKLIDFTSDQPSAWFTPTDRLSCNTLHITRGVMPANPGADLGTTQLVVAVHESAPLEVTWRPPGAERLKHARVAAGAVHVNPADRFYYLRWSEQPALLVMAFKDRLVDRVGEHFGGKRGQDLNTVVGIRDMEIEAIARRLRREMREGGVSGPLFIESLGILVLVRLFRIYAKGARPPTVKGGLGASQFQRVVDYIEAHLGEEILLESLASIAGLSTHHFGVAFRASAGVAPHRFIVERRIERARDLLTRTEASITAIAGILGFASNGHLTKQFRKLTGMTPSKYRSAHQ